MTSLRIFLIGGLTSYRALFTWLTPWILIPVFVLTPIFQILLFAYIGRTAGVGDDAYFLIGNAVLNAAIPCLFAMGNTIGGERNQGTLPLLMASPAKRIRFSSAARCRSSSTDFWLRSLPWSRERCCSGCRCRPGPGLRSRWRSRSARPRAPGSAFSARRSPCGSARQR
ncbi:MAG: type transport system permease protein [Micromonosporaceae bacterium]|nr:type transport system permease protein [Micromonosporaceae bacterium]